MNIKIALLLIGMFIAVGSVGALETDNISMLQCIIQCGIGIGLIMPAVLDKRLRGEEDD